MKINVKKTNKSWTSLKNPKIYGATGKARFDHAALLQKLPLNYQDSKSPF